MSVGDQQLQHTARVEAAKQWNARACGEVDGDQESRDYFTRVEQRRYLEQPWQKAYFRYDEFHGKRVLEIGVGQGTDLLQFARAGAQCCGVDITDNHLRLTAKNFALNSLSVDLRKVDATALPFASNSIDCVYSFGVIHHIPEARAVIAEAHRVLKPSGTLLIALYSKWSAFYLFTKLLYNGLVRGWLFTKGHAGLLATIEEGADGVQIKPFVALYSRSDVRELLNAFVLDDVSIHQLYPGHFSPMLRWLMPTALCRALESYLGWYVAARAHKIGEPG